MVFFSFLSLYKAYQACCRRKGNTVNAMKFEMDLLGNLCSLNGTLEKGVYQPARSIRFVVTDPKYREVFAADFRDRVVHHLLTPHLEKIYESKFIFDSYACRKAKGTHRAVKRLKSFMNKVSKNANQAAWYLQLDIKSFFMSIDHQILLNILKRHLHNKPLFNLAEIIIRHDYTKNYQYKGDPRLSSLVPRHKTLLYTPDGTGLPIGNLTSQFFANLYLNELDQFVKHQLKCRYYLRYMDDFILLDQQQVQLIQWKSKIEQYLEENLRLSVKKSFILKRIKEGADFLGYIVRPDYLLVRNRVTGNLKSRLDKIERKLSLPGAPAIGQVIQLSFPDEEIKALYQILASYLGHFKQASCFNLLVSLWQKYWWLNYAISLKNHKLESLLEPSFSPADLQTQYAWFLRKYYNFLILFRVGRFIEFYGLQAARAADILNLKSGSLNKRRKIGITAGFPCCLMEQMEKKLKNQGVSYVFVNETGYFRHSLKKRTVEKIVFLKYQ